MRRTAPHIRTASGVESYRTNDDGSITAVLDGGEEVQGDVIIGHLVITPQLPHHTPLGAGRLLILRYLPPQVQGDVLIGADGIWSNVRASMGGANAHVT